MIFATWFPFVTPVVAVMSAAATGQGLEVYGPLGVGLGALALFMRELIKWIIRQKEESDRRLEELTNQVMNEVMPVLRSTATLLERREPIDAKLISLLEQLG